MRSARVWIVAIGFLASTVFALTFMQLGTSMLYQSRGLRATETLWLDIPFNELAQAEIFQIVKAGELKYRGRLFDFEIAERTKHGLRFLGHYDNAENWLLRRMQDRSQEGENPFSLSIENWLCGIFFVANSSICISNTINIVLDYRLASSICSGYYGKIEKPPRLMS